MFVEVPHAGLENIDREMRVELAVDDLLRGPGDEGGAMLRRACRVPRLASAAAHLISPRARMNSRPKRWPETGKFRTARWVEAP